MSTRASLHFVSRPCDARRRLLAYCQRRSQNATLPSCNQRYISTPRILSPSFYASLLPSFSRSSDNAASPSTTPSRPRRLANPATPFILLGLLVGSQAIHTLWLKQDREHSLRNAEKQMNLLREVIEKVHKGEDVDVEAALGTGDPQREAEWRAAVDAIAEEEVLFRSRKEKSWFKDKEQAQKVDAEVAERGTENGQPGETVKMSRAERIGGAKFY